MDDLRRWVNLSLIIGAIVMWWLTTNITASLLGTLGATGWSIFAHVTDFEIMGDMIKLSTVVGFVVSVVTMLLVWRNKKLYEGGLNVAREMKKVTWPTKDETLYATKTVIVTSVIVAAILSVFDFFFKWLTGLILGV